MSICHTYDFRPAPDLYIAPGRHVCDQDRIHFCEQCRDHFCAHKAVCTEHSANGRPLIYHCSPCIAKQVATLAKAWATLDPDAAYEGLQAASIEIAVKG